MIRDQSERVRDRERERENEEGRVEMCVRVCDAGMGKCVCGKESGIEMPIVTPGLGVNRSSAVLRSSRLVCAKQGADASLAMRVSREGEA